MMREALCVGISHYNNDNGKQLTSCVNDAKEVQQVLEINEDNTKNFNVNILTGTVQKETLMKNVKELFQKDCEIALFYFAGHGYMDDTRGYLVTSECESGDKGLSFYELWSIASHSPAKNKVLILDCCHSGSAGNMDLSDEDVSFIKEGLIIFSACRSEQNALGINGQGVFTALLLDALRGGAMDLEGNVTPGSAYAYIDKSLSINEQRPTFKANVSSFVSLRKNKPLISRDNLYKLTSYFENPEYEYKLDPTYESASDTHKEENEKIFKVLREYYKVGLIVPIGAEYMYDAAMNSKSCKLTLRGRHYWELVNNKQI